MQVDTGTLNPNEEALWSETARRGSERRRAVTGVFPRLLHSASRPSSTVGFQ